MLDPCIVSGLSIYILCLDIMAVFSSSCWWRRSCCLGCNTNRGGRSHRSLSWHHKKHTTRYLGAYEEGGGEATNVVGVWGQEGFGVGGVSLFYHWLKTYGGRTCECQRLRRLAVTWKLHLWGKEGGGVGQSTCKPSPLQIQPLSSWGA